MKKYDFIIKKTQEVIVSKLCSDDEVLDDVLKRFEEMINQDQLEFSEPTYDLVTMLKHEGKITKIISI